MPSWPMVVLSVLLASLYATVFHVMKGKTLVELPIFWVASLAGFATGALAARVLNLNVLVIGELHVLEASIVSITFLFIARWLKV